MQSILADLAAQVGVPPVILIGVGFGVVLAVFGLAGALAGDDPVARRMSAGAAAAAGGDVRIVRDHGRTPIGLMKALIPAGGEDQSRIRRQFAQAGTTNPKAVRNFYLVKALLGLVLPALFIGAMALNSLGVSNPAVSWVEGLGRFGAIQVIAVLVAIGFYGPSFWLRSKVSARQQVISEGFPNALDLMQISVEAGLGFDAAMKRVAEELRSACPEIAAEFLFAQQEIAAGRDRGRALMDMAERMGIDEAASFANVVVQSMQFGTSISDALLTYANEMRQTRELKAQEKANKLPVQMSGVMASLMLPALIMLAVGPTVLRYMDMQ